MSVDDIAVQGAEPLFFLDYISIGKLVPEIVDDIVAGVARRLPRRPAARCSAARCRSTPTSWSRASSTSSGFAVGVVERDADPARGRARRRRRSSASPAPGCAATATRWPAGAARARRPPPRRARVDGRAPLARRRAAAPERDLRAGDARSCASTSTCTPSRTSPAAGIPGNLARVLPDALRRASSRRGTWDEPRIFARDPGRRRRAPTTRWSTSSTSASACWPSSPRRTVSATLDAIRAAGHEAWIVGEMSKAAGG